MLYAGMLDGKFFLTESNQMRQLVSFTTGDRLHDTVTDVVWYVIVREVEVDCPTCAGRGECCGQNDPMNHGRAHYGLHDRFGVSCPSCGGFGVRDVWKAELEVFDPWYHGETDHQPF